MSDYSNSSALIADRYKITDTTKLVKASGGILTLTGQPLNTETVTIAGKVYTFQSSLIQSDGNVLISPVDASESIDNLIAAIILDPAGTGSRYGSPMTINPDATASAGAGDTMDVVARRPGAFGNSIDLSETLTNGSWNILFLGGGVSANTWLDFNKINRRPSRIGVQTFEIFSDDDFPNPDVGGSRVLTSGFYLIKNSLTTPTKWIIPFGAVVDIQVEAGFNSIITFTGDGTFITGSFHSTFNFEDFEVFLTGNNNKAFDLSFGSVSDSIRFGSFTFAGTGTKTCGTFTFSSGVVLDLIGFFNFDAGITFSSVVFGLIDTNNLISDGTGTGPLINIIGSLFFGFTIRDTAGFTGASESVFFINPDIGLTPNVNILRTTNIGFGNYFKTGDTGIITNIVDGSIGATAITSVTSGTPIVGGPGNYARFNHAGTDVFVGQRVINSTFTPEVTYNQTLIVTVTGAGFFEGNIESTTAPIAFTDDDTGSYLSNVALVTSSVNHFRVDGEALLITNTINFNAGYSVFDTATSPTLFRINLLVAFPGVETSGNWDTGSLTQKDKRVNVQDAGTQQDSMNVAFGGMNANAGATTIASADTYQALDFNTMVQNAATELWTLIDSNLGIFRYDGVNPVSGILTASLTVVKTGGTVIYRFTDSKNGAIPVFATAEYVPIEVKATQVGATLIRPVSVVPGDTIQIMGAAQGSTDNLTVTDFFLAITI